MYGVVVINSQFVSDILLVWRNVSAYKSQITICTAAKRAHCSHIDIPENNCLRVGAMQAVVILFQVPVHIKTENGLCKCA